MFTEKDIDEHVEQTDIQGWKCFRHPLYICMPYTESDMEKDHIIRGINYKLERLEKTNDAVQWIFTHERPYRLEAYLNLPLRFERTPEMLVDIWEDCEHPYINRDAWLMMFEEFDYEHTKSELPEEFTVYRGGSYESGLSWTLDRETANKFAMRDGSKKIWTKTVKKSDVILYTDGRGEKEVILDI